MRWGREEARRLQDFLHRRPGPLASAPVACEGTVAAPAVDAAIGSPR